MENGVLINDLRFVIAHLLNFVRDFVEICLPNDYPHQFLFTDFNVGQVSNLPIIEIRNLESCATRNRLRGSSLIGERIKGKLGVGRWLVISKAGSALLIVGHGSTVNPDSSGPTPVHAVAIRRQVVFRDLRCAFWKPPWPVPS